MRHFDRNKTKQKQQIVSLSRTRTFCGWIVLFALAFKNTVIDLHTSAISCAEWHISGRFLWFLKVLEWRRQCVDRKTLLIWYSEWNDLFIVASH